MPHIAAYDDVKATRIKRELPRGEGWRTNFLTYPAGTDVTEEPMGFLVEGNHERVIRPHYHENDQFQVVVSGGGVLGKHKLAVHAVHFSRAYTPYGPINFGADGLAFLTLRARKDPGAQYISDSREKLAAVPSRAPWQVTEAPDFTRTGDATLRPFTQMKDERGLAGFSLSMAAGATVTLPDPSQTSGQHIIVTRGGLSYQGRDYNAVTVAFIKPHEGAWQVTAGAEGLEAIVLNYPRREVVAANDAVVAKAPGHRVWQCALCAFVYDEARGMPEEGVAAGTRWEEVPETWTCSDCSASKSDFQMRVVG
ncbi:MAG: rubredoxin [Betaproteobacteria bacterium]|nr:rubredoxin [Betaproteobacteria bacterium]